MTQTETILAHLKNGGSITPIDALRDYGCFRLAARIKEIRDEGHDVQTTWDTDGTKKWARYSLAASRNGKGR